MSRIIEVVPHDPAWADAYQTEVQKLAEIFAPDLAEFHHIGSTAIPGILAKPVTTRPKRVELPVSKATGGMLPGIDLNRSSDLEEVMNAP